ncbi:hypothetical protein [Streptomyces sp. NPDC048473]|uniref:hypothetical protein n=1 Tax=Streptomyces sp. NPDC048473 TaxID=3365556 RepID=UPI00371C4EDE
MTATSRIGTNDRRTDAVLKLTGAAQYTADIRLPGMLHAKVLRSPHAHARLVSIDAAKAQGRVVSVLAGHARGVDGFLM